VVPQTQNKGGQGRLRTARVARGKKLVCSVSSKFDVNVIASRAEIAAVFTLSYDLDRLAGYFARQSVMCVTPRRSEI
jgi:hypothetical protein